LSLTEKILELVSVDLVSLREQRVAAATRRDGRCAKQFP
jgi:hypothetical protein